MYISLRNVESFKIIDIHVIEVDKNLVDVLRATLTDVVQAEKVSVAINFSIVKSIDPGLLGCLVTTQKRFKRKGCQVCLFGVQPELLMVFYVLKLDCYLNIYNSEFDAINNHNLLVKRRLKAV